MEEKEENQLSPNPAGDTCGGKPRPAGTKDFICQDGVWVEVDIPSANVQPAP